MLYESLFEIEEIRGIQLKRWFQNLPALTHVYIQQAITLRQSGNDAPEGPFSSAYAGDHGLARGAS
jgi:hypothetical protein